ncbi:MAG: pilus assembly protein TadG-related protein [Candidatus Dormibacteria bacterium]
MIRQKSGSERGQVTVLFAIAAIALVAVVGLAVDAGTSYVDQRSLQAGSDTASTTGASMLAADFHACLSSGILPYSNSAISSAVTAIADSAAAASGKATSLPAVDYVEYVGSTLTDVGAVASYGGPFCMSSSGPGTWAGPMGVRVQAGNSHQTLVLQIVGINRASEQATSTAAFGVLTSGTVIPFVACVSGPLINPGDPALVNGQVVPGDTVLLANKKGSGGWDTACNQVKDANFKGFLPCPPGSKPTCTVQVASGVTSGPWQGGSACGQWPSTIAVGDVVDVPLVKAAKGGGANINLEVLGIIQVQITVNSCSGGGDFNLEGVVLQVGSVTGNVLLCSTTTGPYCANAPFNLASEATGVQLVN